MALFIIAVCVVGIFFTFFILPTIWLKVERVKHDIGINKTILQVSDLHLERNRIAPQKIANIAKRNSVDYLFLTGDFLDQRRTLTKLEEYLDELSQARIPMYAVLGNHDYEIGESLDELAKIMTHAGVTLLRNESIKLDRFTLVGIDDYHTNHYDVEKAYEHVGSEETVVIMTHDADVSFVAQRKGFRYLMAGHLHGKHFNIPFLFKLKPMGDLASQGKYKGTHHFPFGTIYISKGVGQSGINARLWVRSEVTLHYL
jgi:predicted MPP superfamily phosphohydrolase